MGEQPDIHVFPASPTGWPIRDVASRPPASTPIAPRTETFLISPPQLRFSANPSRYTYAHSPSIAWLRQRSMCSYTLRFKLDTVPDDTRVPHKASVMSSTRRTDTPGQVHLHDRFLNRDVPAPVALNDRRLKTSGDRASAPSTQLPQPGYAACASNARHACQSSPENARSAARDTSGRPPRPAARSESPQPCPRTIFVRWPRTSPSSIRITLPNAFVLSCSMVVSSWPGDCCQTTLLPDRDHRLSEMCAK